MSAPKCLFILYNSFSLRLTENLHKQKSFLKTLSTCFVINIIYIKAYKPKKESLPLTVGGTSEKNNIAKLWKDHLSAIAHYVGSTDNRDQVMNALRIVPGHNDVINEHELWQIVRGLKKYKAVVNDGIPSDVYKFASE